MTDPAPTPAPRRFLVTAALPYSNGRLHVGHIAGAYLPADIFVRYLRARGDEVKFICGSDDNGVAALITARNEGVPVEECTAKYNARQKADFESLNIRFDVYGGTHQPGFYDIHEKLSQEFFTRIHERGYFTKKSTDQLYDPVAKQFLPDRYVQGTCPICSYDKAYGDQCDNCGNTMDPLKLLNPKSTITPGVTPEVRSTVHWYLSLKSFESLLREWLEVKLRNVLRENVYRFSIGQLTYFYEVWVPNAEAVEKIRGRLQSEGLAPELSTAVHQGDVRLLFRTWTADEQKAVEKLVTEVIDAVRPPDVPKVDRHDLYGGLPERAMTRDLTWGIPVPLDDPEAAGKVLYVWFDAPIGYISFTAAALKAEGRSPGEYAEWWKNPDCKIVNFIGEDNIVFHAIIWPAMQMAVNERLRELGEPEYQLTSNVVANSFLNMKYPDGKVDKISKTKTPPDAPVWVEEYAKQYEPDPLRYYLTAIAPETARTAFDMDDYFAQNNGVLGNALGNFVNRTLTFAVKYFDGKVPDPGVRGDIEKAQLDECRRAWQAVTEHLEGFRFKAAQEAAMDLARAGNKYFDTAAPFRSRKTDMAAAGAAINVCIQTVKTLAVLFGPFLPDTSRRIVAQLGVDESALKWDQALLELPAGHKLGEPSILFKKFEPAKA